MIRSHSLSPPLEGYERVDGPQNAYSTIQEKGKERSIRTQERYSKPSSHQEHDQTSRHEPCEDLRIERAPLNINVK